MEKPEQKPEQSKKLDRLLEALCADPKVSLASRLRKQGLSETEAAELCGSPDTERAIWSAAARRFLLPIVPALVKKLADKASQGDAKATDMVLKLLGADSPVRGQLGLDLPTMSDKGLEQLTRQVFGELQEIVNDSAPAGSVDGPESE